MRGFALLLAAVLAAIGIGVGAEAARQPTLYGPPGAQFTAAFLARPTVTTTSSGRIGRFVSYEARGPSGQLTVTVWTLRGSGWTGYSPVATLGWSRRSRSRRALCALRTCTSRCDRRRSQGSR